MSVLDFDKTPLTYFGRGKDVPKERAIIGLEAENEFRNDTELPSVKGWSFHGENSLRFCGFEYVLNPPQEKDKALKKTADLLELLNKHSEQHQIPITNSIRTSWHVHFNAGNYKFLDVVNFACLYWILEPILSPFAGEHRQGNLFCLRLKDASWIRNLLQECIVKRTAWDSALFNEHYRYSSINFNSLSKFGTLESRLMRGTTDFKEVETWVNSLDALRKFALRYENPLQLKSDFFDKYNASEFPYEVFGSEYKNLAKFFTKDFSVQKEVRAGFMEVLPILTAHDSFDFREEAEKEAERLKKVKEHYNQLIGGPAQAWQQALQAAAEAPDPAPIWIVDDLQPPLAANLQVFNSDSAWPDDGLDQEEAYTLPMLFADYYPDV